MSINVLSGDGHVHSLDNNMESFIFYVVLYAALQVTRPVMATTCSRPWTGYGDGQQDPRI
jgi:hypothetical protein